MKKALLIGGGAIVVVVVAAIVLLVSNIDSIIRTTVEEVGSRATQAKVTLDEVEISTDGNGALRGFTVGNPAGFEAPSAFRLGDVSVSLDVASVTEDTVHVREIMINGPEVTYEWVSGGSNLETLKRNVEEFAAAGSKSDSGRSEASGEGGKKLVIDRLVLRDGKVTVAANAEFLKGRQLKSPLPDIEMRDIGKKSGGASAGEVIAQVMERVTAAASKSVASLDIDKLTKSLEGLSGGAVQSLKDQAGGTGDSISQGADEASRALKKLFGN